MITEAFIKQRYNELLTATLSVIKPEAWAVTPSAEVSLGTRKAAFGLATKKGKVLLHPAFVGTTAFRKLDQTILHELAHLIVGLAEHHGRRWKRIADAIGMTSEHLAEEEQQVIANVTYKYTIYVHLENGEVRNIGQVHAKTKTYTSYPNGKIHRTKDGIKVSHYEFVENQKKK
jgi:predicted SprT family Zn-dependent metalloprotease